MFQVRIHGRGGQGVVTAAEMLSVAAYLEGKHAQAFPSFGSERTGAPVVAFCRIDDKEIRLREPILEPDALIVQDPTLFKAIDVCQGLKPGGYLLVNSNRSLSDLHLDAVAKQLPAGHVLTVPATELALKHVGRPLPNAALLGAFARLTGLIHLQSRRRRDPRGVSGKDRRGEYRRRHRRARRRRQRRRRRGCLRIIAMLKQIEGSRAMAEAIALCRPEVICAYPITPQTHIVEGLGEMVRTGAISKCEFINVESEFAALSVAIGASAAGARAYTATASQGLLFMAEAVYNASGLGLPIVMTLGNRAIGAPINIWNDHSDAMAMRDSGWMQLFAETNQEAADLHIQAFRLAEELSMPVMVCVDGFILTHAVERVDIPEQADVDAYLPPYEPVQVLDPQDPISIGAMVGPEAFTEVRYLQHYKQTLALRLIPEYAAAFKKQFGRDSGGLLRSYRCEDAELIVVAMGSVNGTIKDTIDEMRADGLSVGLVTLVSFRPFPTAALREKLVRARNVVVIEKSLAVGMGGPLANNVDLALRNVAGAPQVHSVIAGLGGRPITKASLHRVLRGAFVQPWEGSHFLDLNEKIVAKELHYVRKVRRSGPTAENLLRRLGQAEKAAV